MLEMHPHFMLPILLPEHTSLPGLFHCKLRKLDIGKKRDYVNKIFKHVNASYECPSCNVGLCVQCFHDYLAGQ